jgi:rRNA small subunit pseudouridine methyltransferase Nep1
LLNIVLADCDLELVPTSLLTHPSVIGYAKKRGKQAKMMLLDDNYHHGAIRQRFPDTDTEQRRGRPDIVHFNMVYILDSIANLQGKVRLFIHTRNNQVIKVNPATRIPRSYARFVGVMEKLLFEGKVTSEEGMDLLEVEEDRTLPELLVSLRPALVVGFSVTGGKEDLGQLLKEDATAVVGGFSKGDFISKFTPDVWVSVYPEELMSWTVVAEIMKHV